MPVSIATWNVNSVKARTEHIVRWLSREDAPDVLLLQELKCMTDAVPADRFREIGYETAAHGQKAYNGVAILSKLPMEEIVRDLPGNPDDDHARWIEAKIAGVRIAGLYLPNGNPIGDPDGGAPNPKFTYKLAWMDRMADRVSVLLESGDPLVLGGDYNVIPEPRDCYAPENWKDDALFRPESRAAFWRLQHLGLTDAFRSRHPGKERAFTFWDYQAGAWPKDNGIRIDHFLLNAEAADRLEDCWIDRGPRGEEKASDHTPVVVRLS